MGVDQSGIYSSTKVHENSMKTSVVFYVHLQKSNYVKYNYSYI